MAEMAQCPRHGLFDVEQGGCEPCESEALRAQERAEDEAYRGYSVDFHPWQCGANCEVCADR